MANWIIEFIGQQGYLGVALLMILENVFPPIPSELIMPFAGFVAARGDLNGVGVLLAGTVGSVLGTMPWYVAGRFLSVDRLKAWAGRYGRWLAMSPGDIEQAEHWFRRRGERAVFLGRMVPAVRSVISASGGHCRHGPAALPGVVDRRLDAVGRRADRPWLPARRSIRTRGAVARFRCPRSSSGIAVVRLSLASHDLQEGRRSRVALST